MRNVEMALFVAAMLLLRVGQTLLLAGCVRSKNAAGVAVRCLLDLAVVTLALWAIGAAVVPMTPVAGGRPWVAWGQLLGNGAAGAAVVGLLPGVLILTGATLGATAERVRLAPPLVFAAAVAGLIFPLLFRVADWLSTSRPRTHLDLLIATVGGGAAAVAMAHAAGARKGKFNRDLSVNFVPGHAVVLQLVGLLLLAAGWAATTANALHTLLGLAAAVLAGAAFGRFRFGKIDVGLTVAAGVGGLAAAGLAAVSPAFDLDSISANRLGAGGAASVLAGALAGAAVPWAVMWIESRCRVDDVVGLGAAYAVGGTIGVAVAAVTSRGRTAGEYFTGLAVDAAVWAVAVGVVGGTAFWVARLLRSRGGLRVSETVEYDGVDLSELDVNAYPDFQQTMIKSHHLRQL